MGFRLPQPFSIAASFFLCSKWSELVRQHRHNLTFMGRECFTIKSGLAHLVDVNVVGDVGLVQ